MPAFQDREEEMQHIVTLPPGSLLNIYGESGLGKTRLLAEAAGELSRVCAEAQVLYVDLDPLKDRRTERLARLLRDLLEAAGGQLPVSPAAAQAVGPLVDALNQLAEAVPVYVMFDSTEALQDDETFWRELEAHLIGPFVVAGRIRLIVAGRVQVPWRQWDVRRRVKLLHLTPLGSQAGTSESEPPARKLATEALLQANPELATGGQLDVLIGLVLEFSFGHPLLCQKLATYLALQDVTLTLSEQRRAAGENVVRPFIVGRFFAGVSADWQQILWLASVLTWFDASTLEIYLKQVAPGLVQKNWEAFFIRGIADLRIQHSLVAWEDRGYRLYGVIRDIVLHCFEVTNSLDQVTYRQALAGAGAMLLRLAEEFPPEDDDAYRYRREAGAYFDLAAKETLR